MEALAVLEKKVEELVRLVGELRQKNNALLNENVLLAEQKVALEQRVEQYECQALGDSQRDDDERQRARDMVDGLIREISAIVEQEH
jgi:regulator of replication initiation timing